ncbi:DBL containing protein, unknown function [Reticulomyxa filosa]|uniref:Uncharacterized protein n=1 Tax=Reticulomyxa filosa TaxID=46433 RepID=X6PCN9_RETFI|nr:DBL containing protein, unknown function [Reticulomyxa filosa]|eukprot:ETO35412.1 DBL containing protein, unknown function [Reticulomyxa filosa]
MENCCPQQQTVLQKQDRAIQQVLLEQMDDCFIVVRRYLNEVIRVRRLKKKATNKDTKNLQITNFAMAQSINLLQISLKDCYNKKRKGAIQLAQAKLTNFDLKLNSLIRNLEDEEEIEEIKKRVTPIRNNLIRIVKNESVALNPGPKLNEKKFNEDTVGNILDANHEKKKNNTKSAVNKLLSTKTKYMDKSSMMFDIDPNCLDDTHFSPEEREEEDDDDNNDETEGVKNNSPDFDQETIEYPFFSTGSKNHSTKHNKQNNKMDIECDNTMSQSDLDKDKKNGVDDDSENILYSDERSQTGWEDYFNQDVNKNKCFNFFTKNKQEMDTNDDGDDDSDNKCDDNFMSLQNRWDHGKKDIGQDKNHEGMKSNKNGSKNTDKRTTKKGKE